MGLQCIAWLVLHFWNILTISVNRDEYIHNRSGNWCFVCESSDSLTSQGQSQGLRDDFAFSHRVTISRAVGITCEFCYSITDSRRQG